MLVVRLWYEAQDLAASASRATLTKHTETALTRPVCAQATTYRIRRTNGRVLRRRGPRNRRPLPSPARTAPDPREVGRGRAQDVLLVAPRRTLADGFTADLLVPDGLGYFFDPSVDHMLGAHSWTPFSNCAPLTAKPHGPPSSTCSSWPSVKRTPRSGSALRQAPTLRTVSRPSRAATWSPRRR
jgi:hypothetical protein